MSKMHKEKSKKHKVKIAFKQQSENTCRVNEATLQSLTRRANPLPLNKKDASTHRLACAFPGPPVFLGHHFPLANHAVLSSHLNNYAEG